MDGRIQDERILKLELRLAQLEKNEECQNTFLSFVKNMTKYNNNIYYL